MGLVARLLCACIFLAAYSRPASPQERLADGVVSLETVLVTGSRPAPALWRIEKPGSTILLMGTISPVPKGLTWSSENVIKEIERTNVIVGPPGVVVGTDIGVIRGALLLPAMRRMKQNPGGRKLTSFLDQTTTAEWVRVKDVYLRGRKDVDQLRPVYAAQELFEAAVSRRGMTMENPVAPILEALSGNMDIPYVNGSFVLNVKDPNATLKKVNATDYGDAQCLQKTMSTLAADLESAAQKANAWALGDIEALRQLYHNESRKACIQAFGQTTVAREQGITDLAAQVEGAWISKVLRASEKNSVVFSSLPVDMLMRSDGVLRRLESEGYRVTWPE